MNRDWFDKAVCTSVGGELFFPELGVLPDDAKAICRSCEVRVECLAFAVENSTPEGVFGGFTERPRRKIARELAVGRSLEDIIAEDDAKFYARLEKAA